MSKVYVPQEILYKNEAGLFVPKFNLEPAREFGEIVVLLPYGDVMLAPQPMVRKLKQSLKDFCDDDYLLPTGDPTVIGMVVAIAASMNRGQVKILRWDGRARQYNVLKYTIHGNKYIPNNEVGG